MSLCRQTHCFYVRSCMGILYFDHPIFCRCQHYCILIDSGVALKSTFYFGCLDLMRLTTWHLWTLGLHGNYVRISVFSCNPTGSHNKMTIAKQLSNCLCDGHPWHFLAIGRRNSLQQNDEKVHLFSLWCKIIWWHCGSEALAKRYRGSISFHTKIIGILPVCHLFCHVHFLRAHRGKN